MAGSENATGDDQKKLDVLSDEIMVNALYHSHVCAVLVSEEREEPIIVPEPMSGKDQLIHNVISVDFELVYMHRKILCCF